MGMKPVSNQFEGHLLSLPHLYNRKRPLRLDMNRQRDYVMYVSQSFGDVSVLNLTRESPQ